MRDLIHRATHLAETHPRADAALAAIGTVAMIYVIGFVAAYASAGAP